MVQRKVLISSRSFGKINSGATQLLKDNGFIPVVNSTGKKLDENQISDLIDDEVVGIIAGTEQITQKVIEKSSNLKVISRYGVGMDNVDLEFAKKKQIKVINTPDAPSLAVAELTLSLILHLLKRIGICDRRLRDKTWKGEVGNLLTGKTVGILGLGRIGKKVVELMKPFQVKLLVYDPFPDEKFISEHNISLVRLNELTSSSDIISLHLPLTDKTRYIISKNELLKMKKEAFLINTARGGLINEDDLFAALENNEIAGAGIDVFEQEPDTNNLEQFENVVITPHIATMARETRKQMEIEAAENIIHLMEG